MNRKKCIRALVSLFIFAFFVATLSAAVEPSGLLLDKDPDTVIADLKSLIPELMKKSRVPGLQIALVRNGKIAWQQGFGVRNAKTGEPVDETTIFEAASLTKPMFAYAVMKLVEEGVVDLDKPLINYLPKKQVEEELGHPLDAEGFHKDWLEKITGRHVLSHSGGMPHGESGKTYPLFFEPGTKWKYSAAGYYFLQLVVERLKGEKLETFMKKYVLDPLGMKQSCLVWRDEYEKTSANGHGSFGRPEEFRKRTRAHSAATLYTTAEDYARFVCAVLNGQGIKKETLKEMLTPQIDVDKEKGLTWSLGFGLQQDKNGSAFWQWGDYGIFRNYIIAYPESKLAVVYLTNSFYGLSICPDLVARSIGGQALGNAFLAYDHYDSPRYQFAWAVKDQGAPAVQRLFPKMKKSHPDKFSQRYIRWLGGIMVEEKMFDEAIALYEMSVKENPYSGTAIGQLARVHLEKGDRKTARKLYEKALKVNRDKEFDAKPINWALAYIKTLEEPLQLPEEHLKKLAGDYQTRHVKFKQGTLFYFRENTENKEYRPLIAMAKDTFIIEGLVFFRLKFAFDKEGNPTKAIGLYDNGSQDQTSRDK